ncbi:MAG TPA: YbdK family carboxylate-amine ligase [Solirubrobacteraceae bacterium]|jgi:carboxylate-amine ligase|nr:YbdK family carboxylate-amine ligase [Solirubrobacteraceae bacterium]
MTEHAFGRAPAFTVGIEEELLLVDRDTHQLAPNAADVLSRLDGLPPGSVGHEAFAAELELRSPAADDAEAASTALGVARAAAGRAGATLIGAGLHPSAALGDAELVAKERYRRVEDEMRGLIRRTPECALHVHVGMPDADAAVHALNGLREALPLLQALAANSPYWFGRDSGLASARAAAVRAYPGRGAPRAFRNWDDYAATADEALRAGDLPDYTYLWWDIRLQPRLGTVEVRELDAQAPLRDIAAIAGLIHAIALRAVEDPPRRTTAPEALAWSAWMASRDGLDAHVLDADGIRRSLRDIARRTAAELEQDEAERLASDGNGAQRQRIAYAHGGLRALLGELVRMTSDL